MSRKYNTDRPDRPSLGHASLGDTSAQALDRLVDEMMEGCHDGGTTANYGENCRGRYGPVLTGTTLMRSHGELGESQVEPRSLRHDLGDIIADSTEQQPRQPGGHMMSSRSESESSLANDYMTDEGSDEELVSDHGQSASGARKRGTTLPSTEGLVGAALISDRALLSGGKDDAFFSGTRFGGGSRPDEEGSYGLVGTSQLQRTECDPLQVGYRVGVTVGGDVDGLATLGLEDFSADSPRSNTDRGKSSTIAIAKSFISSS